MDDYKIPTEILSKIPEYFWAGFVGELVSVFGLDLFDKVDDEECVGADFVTGTSGWNYAFRAACDKLNLEWLFDYYDKLDWMRSDVFDGEILDKVLEKFVSQNGEGTSPYYIHLVDELG